MPVYEYSCLKCGYRFEKLQKNSSTIEPDCPTCGSNEVKKELSTFSSVGSTSSAGCFSGGG
jgi:putative FmdB family regulatory protein